MIGCLEAGPSRLGIISPQSIANNMQIPCRLPLVEYANGAAPRRACKPATCNPQPATRNPQSAIRLLASSPRLNGTESDRMGLERIRLLRMGWRRITSEWNTTGSSWRRGGRGDWIGWKTSRNETAGLDRDKQTERERERERENTHK